MLDVKTDSFRTRKGWVKLHAIVDIRTRVIIDCMVTDSAVADINGLYVMLCTAHVQHDICHGNGIKPKSNTVRNAKGQSWREMVSLYMDDRDKFDSQYHQRASSRQSLPPMYGDGTRC